MESENYFKIMVHSESLDVDLLSATIDLKFDGIWKKGDVSSGAALYTTNGIELSLGNGETLNRREQEAIAFTYLRNHYGEIWKLANFDNMSTCILGLHISVTKPSRVATYSVSLQLSELCKTLRVSPIIYVVTDMSLFLSE